MCEKLLSAEIANEDRVKHFVECDPSGDCQKHQLSPFGPGPVGDDEFLARSVDFPLRDDYEGGLNDSLFQDAFSVGASVQRVHAWSTQANDIHARYEQRASRRRSGGDGRAGNPEWRYIGAVHVLASELRQIKLPDAAGKSGVRVYDTAPSQSDSLHADVMVDVSQIQNNIKQGRKLLRVMLLTAAYKRGVFLSPHVSPDDPSVQKLNAIV